MVYVFYRWNILRTLLIYYWIYVSYHPKESKLLFTLNGREVETGIYGGVFLIVGGWFVWLLGRETHPSIL